MKWFIEIDVTCNNEWLFKFNKEHDLTLTLFKKFITWKNRITTNIIDFTFITIHLIDKLKHCTTKIDLNQSSNHISISTRIFCEIESNSFRIFRRMYKSIEFEKNQKSWKNALILSRSSSIREIDEYVCEIQKFLQSMMKKIVFWIIFNRYVKSFWIKECDDVVKTFVDLNVVNHSVRMMILRQSIRKRTLFRDVNSMY